MVYPTPAQFCSCSCSASSVRSTNGLGHFYVQLRTFLWLLHPSSTCTLPSLLHSLCSCTPSTLALPLVPLPLVLDIAPDLTLVKSTSDPYLSSSDLVPFTSLSLLFLRCPCNTSSLFLLPLWIIFLSLDYFPVPGLFSCPWIIFLYLDYFPVHFCSVPCLNIRVFTCHRIYSPLVSFLYKLLNSGLVVLRSNLD